MEYYRICSCFNPDVICIEEKCEFFWHYCLKCCCYDNGCKADIEYKKSACRVVEELRERYKN